MRSLYHTYQEGIAVSYELKGNPRWSAGARSVATVPFS